jgi:hypothetical protein
MDNYGYDKNRRLHWVLIVAAVLGGAALLAVGFGLGRVSAPSPAPGSRTTAGSQAGPGPTRVVNGVPVGYAHTQAGAVAAATNFLMVVDGPLVTQPDKYRAAIDTLAAPEKRDRLQGVAEANLTASQTLLTSVAQGHAVVSRTYPLSYRVMRYADDAAQVSIWAEGIEAVDGLLPMREVWATSTVIVQWSAGDWKLSSIGGSSAGSSGPAPLITQASVQDSSLPPQLSNYRSYGINVGP